MDLSVRIATPTSRLAMTGKADFLHKILGVAVGAVDFHRLQKPNPPEKKTY